jgi:hypothetical protein
MGAFFEYIHKEENTRKLFKYTIFWNIGLFMIGLILFVFASDPAVVIEGNTESMWKNG